MTQNITFGITRQGTDWMKSLLAPDSLADSRLSCANWYQKSCQKQNGETELGSEREWKHCR